MRTKGEVLQQLTEDFAAQLHSLLSQVLSEDAKYSIKPRPPRQKNPRSALRLTNLNDNGKEGFPLVRTCDNPASPSLLIRSSYTLELDKSSNYLQIETSTLGLWSNTFKGQKRPRPLIRIEYDREKRMFAPAHVHFHAHSSELGWIYGSSNQKMNRPQSIHFPVGGRRFRPTLEDFLLFLDQEKIFTNWKDENYKELIENSRSKWEKIQARTTVRWLPQEAAETLEGLGYRVIPPDQSE